MRLLIWFFAIAHGAIAVLFVGAALVLTVVATRIGWQAASGGMDAEAAQKVIEAVGLLAAAVVALRIAQTIAEEEVIREAQVSAPTRVRRFLSRFLVVVVALAIESLVSIFKLAHEDATKLPHAASIAAGAALLLAAWGVFIKLNRSAEELEPEAMEKTKQEDRNLEE